MILDHVAIQVSNVSNSVKWYKDNLDAKVLYCDDTWAMLEIGGTKLAITIPEQHPSHIAFRVDKIEKIPSPAGKHRDGSVYQYIEDPDGNSIEYIFYP